MQLCRAVATNPHIVVTDFEADLPAAYTVSTLAFLKARSPLVRFVWIMGADNLATFDRWERWREIFTMVPVVVVDRPGWRLKALASKAARAFAQGPQARSRRGQPGPDAAAGVDVPDRAALARVLDRNPQQGEGSRQAIRCQEGPGARRPALEEAEGRGRRITGWRWLAGVLVHRRRRFIPFLLCRACLHRRRPVSPASSQRRPPAQVAGCIPATPAFGGAGKRRNDMVRFGSGRRPEVLKKARARGYLSSGANLASSGSQVASLAVFRSSRLGRSRPQRV